MKYGITLSIRRVGTLSLFSQLLVLLCSFSCNGATFLVSNVNDNGPGSLRQAITDSNINGQDDSIDFDAILFQSPQTITLTTGPLEIGPDNSSGASHSVSINGPGPDLLSIDGSDQSRVIMISGPTIVVLSSVTVTGGNATGGLDFANSGGGIFVQAGWVGENINNLTLVNSVIRDNRTGSTGGSGGGILVSGYVAIFNSAVINNTASYSAGGILHIGGELKVVNTTVSENTAVEWAGGIENVGIPITIVNSTVAFNRTTGPNSFGAGITLRPWSPNIYYFCFIRNSIFSNNIGQLTYGKDIWGPVVSRGHSIYQTLFGADYGVTTGNQIGIDPHLDPILSPNGGVIPSHAPLSDSRAIDRGTNCVLRDQANGGCEPFAVTSDQRGVSRPQDGDGDNSAIVDVGAIEYTTTDLSLLPGVPDLVASCDSGVSSTDNITNIRDLDFNVDRLINGGTVEFYRDDILLSSSVVSGSTIVLTDSDAPANGAFSYRVRQRVESVYSPFSSLDVTIDTTPPQISVEQADNQIDPTRTQPIHYTATLDSTVNGLDATDMSFAGSIADTSNATVVVAVSRPTFDISVDGITGNGPVVLSVPPDRFTDVAGNGNSQSTSSDNSVTVDTTPISHLDAPRIDPSFFSGIGFDGDVLDMALQSDGKLIIAGKFNGPVGTSWKKIVRLQADGNLDGHFDPGTGANGDVYCVKVMDDGRILVGGAFTSFNGVAAGHLVRLFPNGALDRTFDTSVGANGNVYSIGVLPGGSMLIGGNFTTYGGDHASQLARITADGSLDTSFNADNSLQPGAVITSIVRTPDDRVLINGNIPFPNGRTGIGRLLANGQLDPSFTSPFTSGAVQSVSLAGDKILIAGTFVISGHTGIARLNFDGSVDPLFVGPAINNVTHMVVQIDHKIIVSGPFVVNGSARVFKTVRREWSRGPFIYAC